jgi:hypothetical protein
MKTRKKAVNVAFKLGNKFSMICGVWSVVVSWIIHLSGFSVLAIHAMWNEYHRYLWNILCRERLALAFGLDKGIGWVWSLLDVGLSVVYVGRNLGLVDGHSSRGADLVEHLRSAVIMEKTMIIVQNIKVRGKNSWLIRLKSS